MFKSDQSLSDNVVNLRLSFRISYCHPESVCRRCRFRVLYFQFQYFLDVQIILLHYLCKDKGLPGQCEKYGY